MFCCEAENTHDRPHPIHFQKTSRGKCFGLGSFFIHVIVSFFAETLLKETESTSDYNYMWPASAEKLLEMDMQEHFEVDWESKSINESVWCVAFIELGSLRVDFLCSQSAVRLLPYRDTTERKVLQVGKGKQKDELPRFTLQVSTCRLLNL